MRLISKLKKVSVISLAISATASSVSATSINTPFSKSISTLLPNSPIIQSMTQIDQPTSLVYNSEAAPFFNGIKDTQIYLNQYIDLRAGITAIDKKDGDLTDDIVIMNTIQADQEGEYIVHYSVENSQGITAFARRTISVLGKSPHNPTIHGMRDIYIGSGTDYMLFYNVKAYDYLGNDITDRINVSGSVNTDKIGTYKLTYTVTDQDGREGKATRKIVVLW